MLSINGQISEASSVNEAYNYNDSKISSDINPVKVGEKLGLAPQYQGNLWVKYNVVGGLGFAVGANFSSETPMLQAPASTTPGYSVFDGAVFYKVNRITLNLNVNNVFDNRYYTGAVRLTERYYPGAPRNVVFRVGYVL